jgi:hypothetical protein
VKAWASYAAAVAIGLATPVLVLWIGRTTPVGTDPSFAGGPRSAAWRRRCSALV